jgi:hypothetical protein
MRSSHQMGLFNTFPTHKQKLVGAPISPIPEANVASVRQLLTMEILLISGGVGRG